MKRMLEMKLKGLRRSAEDEPADGKRWQQIAELLVELERDQEAIEAARRALRHAPDDTVREHAQALLLGLGDEPPTAVPASAEADTAGDEEAPKKGALRLLRGGRSGSAGEDVAAFGDREPITFEQVGGLSAIKEQIRMKIVLPFQQPEIFAAFGKKRGGGILMYGPPGCGKTLLARATAGECRATFMNVAINEVLDMWFGQSERKLAALFEDARRRAPTVLFFDELEAIGASRQQMRHSPGKSLVNVLLAEMDGMSHSNDRVLVMGATNAPWHVDPALLRPGRFDRIQFVPTPDEPARRAILDIQLQSRPTAKLDVAWLARKTKDWSGADLADLVERAIEVPLRAALQTGQVTPLEQKHLKTALKSGRPSTRDWFASARNYAAFANVGGLYDDLVAFLDRNR